MNTKEFAQLILKLDDLRAWHQEMARCNSGVPTSSIMSAMGNKHQEMADTLKKATDQLIHEFGRAGA